MKNQGARLLGGVHLLGIIRYMSNSLTFEILIQISQNFQERRRNTLKVCLQNFIEIDLELTEKSAKNTHRWWKLTATIVCRTIKT